MIREKIMQMAQSDPRFAEAIDAIERTLINMPLTPEDLDEAIQLLEFVIQNPDKYAEVRQAAIDDEEIDESILPPQFDLVYIVSVLVALYGLQDRLGEKGYARGGLAVAARRVQAAGRNGDTQLAHINPREAAMLRRAGGSGTINPATGLPEYFKMPKWGNVIAAALPIALSFIAPGVGTAIGTSIAGGLLGGTAAAGLIPYVAPALGGALFGAGSSFLTGGNPLQGALTGAIGSGLGGVVGSGISEGLGLGLPTYASNILGGALVGSGAAALQKRNPLSGALRGALGAGAGELTGALGQEIAGVGPGAGSDAVARGVAASGQGFGTALTTGAKPVEALAAGALTGLAAGMAKPSQAVVQNMQSEVPLATPVQQPDGTLAPAPGSAGVMPDGRPATYQLNPTTGFIELQPRPGSFQLNPQTQQVEFRAQQPGVMESVRNAIGLGGGATTTTGGQQGGGLGSLLGGNAVPLLAGAALLAGQGGGQQQAAPPATPALSAAQQEYINRPSITWDWARMQRDAEAANLTLNQFMARNWPRITSGEYNTSRMAQGGLSVMSRFVKGGGTGRSDEINAKLSDGEYVIDAETVAMIGDGSSKAGAKKLDEMRAKIRQHKGKALAKGKFSPDAKSPLTYLKGVA